VRSPMLRWCLACGVWPTSSCSSGALAPLTAWHPDRTPAQFWRRDSAGYSFRSMVKRTSKRTATPPRRRGGKPAPRKARRTVRRKSKSHRQTAETAVVLLRSVAILGLVTLVVMAFPPLRRGASAAAMVLAEAMAESRKVELRRLATARLALEYGVSLQLASDIEHAALAEGIDPELAFRLVYVESRFHEQAVSSAGALGLTQLMPATAASLQPGITREQIFERHTNLRLGLRYLRWLLDVYDG